MAEKSASASDSSSLNESEDSLPPIQTWALAPQEAAVWLAAARWAQLQQFAPGQVLYRQGEVGPLLYFLLSGRVQVSMVQGDGSEFVLEVMGRWSVCGEGSALDGQPRFASAVALEDTQVLAFDTRALQRYMAHSPQWVQSLLRVVAIKQRVLAGRIACLAQPVPERRIGELLARLADQYGEVADDGRVALRMALTHEQVAAMTGTSRVTVTRALKRLRAEGVLAVERRRWWILDRTRLLG